MENSRENAIHVREQLNMAFQRMSFKCRWLYLVGFLLAGIALLTFKSRLGLSSGSKKSYGENAISEIIPFNIPLPSPSFERCRMHTNKCFNLYRCGYNEENKISVYVYPLTNYFDENGNQLSPTLSREFYELMTALRGSSYYTENMDSACVIVPVLDTLNQRRIDLNNAGRILNGLDR